MRCEATTDEILKAIGPQNLENLLTDWPLWARPDQLPNAVLDPHSQWRSWVVLGGRGAGKTRTGAEWIRHMALGKRPLASRPCKRIALIGPTLGEARNVMVEGVSGLLAVHAAHERPVFLPSRNQLHWPNGAIAQIFSSEEPDSLRGPQFEVAWCDELAKWNNLNTTWDMLQFALRLGDNPRAVITTTPRPVKLLKDLLAADNALVTRATSHANAAFLAPGFLAEIERQYGGTRLGRQEIAGELITDRPDALFKRETLEKDRGKPLPGMTRIIVAVDPPASSHSKSNACGIICAGLGEDGHAYVLEDTTEKMASPTKWAQKAIATYHKWQADRLIVETNQGGEMATTIIANIDASVAVKPVHAARAKHIRAEPVAALYEQAKVHHCQAFAMLEDEMCAFENTLSSSAKSPDRVDALVWAISELMLTRAPGSPRISVL